MREWVSIRSGLREPGAALLLVPAVMAFMIAVGAGILARRGIPLHHVTWVIRPVVYLDHTQNADGPWGITGVGGHVISIAVVAMAVLLCCWVYVRAASQPLALRVSLGLICGTALANAYEFLAFGSVTDYIGLRRMGILNIADVMGLLGFAIAISTWRVDSRAFPSWATRLRVWAFLGVCWVVGLGAVVFDVVTGRGLAVPVILVGLIVIFICAMSVVQRWRRMRGRLRSPGT